MMDFGGDMLQRMKKVMPAACILALCLALLLTIFPGDVSAKQTDGAVDVPIKSVNDRGNVVLDIGFDEMRANGMDVGDLITAAVADREYVIPIGTSYTDVDSGEMICRFDLQDNKVVLAVNMGSFAGETGISEGQAAGHEMDDGFREIAIALREKGGFLEQYNMRNLTRTNVREDYSDLTDEEFANFRAVSVAGIRENTLYRSSSPIDPSIGRNEYAMAAMSGAGINTVINLDDSPETMRGYDAYPGSYYSQCDIFTPEMSYDFLAEEFAGKVRDSVLFMIDHDGPYLIHCKEGKDRTGIMCAVLECFAGASADDVITDYMITYGNFYRVFPEDAAYGAIAEGNLAKTLRALFRVDQLDGANLKAEAADYLMSIGLTEEQLSLLSAKLGVRDGAH